MTFRESLADWLTCGGYSAACRLKNRFEVEIAQANAELRGVQDIAADLVIALREIAAMETPKANATVKRMAKTAREAMK